MLCRMDVLHDLRGIITVLNTPFTADDRIDVPGLRRNVTNALAAGVAGFLVPAMASEVGALSAEERDLLVRETIAMAAGKSVVIGGASAGSRAERLQVGARLRELGCDGILVSVPYENPAQYESEVRAMADLAPPFLMIQDWDSAGSGVPVPVLARLFAAVPAFECLKVETVPAGVKYTAVLDATGGRLHVSGGWAVTQMIEALDRGVHALMPTGMHAIYTRIYQLYAAGDRNAAQMLFHKLAPVLAFSNQHLDISIHFFKRLLHYQGVYATSRVRAPKLDFDAYHARIADELMAHAAAIEADLHRG